MKWGVTILTTIEKLTFQEDSLPPKVIASTLEMKKSGSLGLS